MEHALTMLTSHLYSSNSLTVLQSGMFAHVVDCDVCPLCAVGDGSGESATTRRVRCGRAARVHTRRSLCARVAYTAAPHSCELSAVYSCNHGCKLEIVMSCVTCSCVYMSCRNSSGNHGSAGYTMVGLYSYKQRHTDERCSETVTRLRPQWTVLCQTEGRP